MPLDCGHETPARVLRGESLAFLTLNTGHGRNRAVNQVLVSAERTRENLDRIAGALDSVDADVVALQEADGPSWWSGGFSHVDYLRDRTDLDCSVLSSHSDSWLASYGTALLARAAMRESVSVKFPASPPTMAKGFIMSQIIWEAEHGPAPVTVVSVHLDFSRRSVRDRQVAILVSTLSGIDTPLVLMGDMNSRWGEERSHVRQLADGLELDAYDPASNSLGTYKSSAGKRLDWILVSRELEFVDYRVISETLSDHLPVFAVIKFRSTEES